MDLSRSRKTPIEAFGVRSLARQKKAHTGQHCTCRAHRAPGGTIVTEDYSDEDVHSPKLTASANATMNSSTSQGGATGYCAQCASVYCELREVDDAVRQGRRQPPRTGVLSAQAAARTSTTRSGGREGCVSCLAVRSNEQLMGAPFRDATGTGANTGRSHAAGSASSAQAFLPSILRVQQAAQWLAECPVATLRVLQQHTLCHLEGYITDMVGIPPYMQNLLPHDDHESESSLKGYDEGVQLPVPLDLGTFLAEFLVVEEAEVAQSGAQGPSTSTPSRRLLRTGRPLPAAPVSAVDMPYGTFLVEEALKSPNGPSVSLTDPQTLADAREWTHFFSVFWDPAKEAQCREPVGLLCAILHACSEVGARELTQRVDAAIARAVRQHCAADDSASHRHTCDACRARQHHIQDVVTCSTLRLSSSRGATTNRANAGVRLFLRTPVVVLWLASYLQLNRMTFGAHQHAAGLARTVSIDQDAEDRFREVQDDSGLLDTDVVPPGEAYAMRDALLSAIEHDTDGFADQEEASTLRISASSSTDAAVQHVCLRKPELLASVAKLSAWMDANVQRGRGLRARVILHVLREQFPVTAYYFSYFAS